MWLVRLRNPRAEPRRCSSPPLTASVRARPDGRGDGTGPGHSPASRASWKRSVLRCSHGECLAEDVLVGCRY